MTELNKGSNRISGELNDSQKEHFSKLKKVQRDSIAMIKLELNNSQKEHFSKLEKVQRDSIAMIKLELNNSQDKSRAECIQFLSNGLEEGTKNISNMINDNIKEMGLSLFN